MDIQIKKLSLSFGEKHVFSDFSARFPSGKISCIMGASGSGKTTLLNLMMGGVAPDSGVISGVPERFSAVFQEDRLCEDFTALTNIKLVLPRNTPHSAVISALDAVGLSDSIDKPVREFSGGMKRRVAVVRAIMAPGDAIFMDEPFRGLDEDTMERTFEYIRRNLGGRTCVIATHNSAVPERFGASILIL